MIGEIEESDAKPVHVFGKFMASALSRYFVASAHSSPIGFDDEVHFVQILSSDTLHPTDSSKPDQWSSVEAAIQGAIPNLQTKIATYRIFHGTTNEFRTSRTDDVLEHISTVL